MRYEYNQDDLNGLVEYLGADTRRKGNELVFKYCPVCHSSATDKYTSSINITNGLFNCKRGSCPSPDLNFVQLARECGYSIPSLAATSFYKYQQIPEKYRDTRQEAVDYLKGRGIPEEVTRRYYITMDSHQTDKVMLFPFYDENNVCQMYKCRNTKPLPNQNKEWLFKASDMKETECQKMILFGMYQCNYENKTLIVTEGQIDSLSVATAGFDNAVSVPNGKNGMTWWDNCKEWIYKNFTKVIIFGDYEGGEMSLLNYFESNCDIPVWHVRPIDYLDCKDANEILTRYGVDDVRRCIDNAVEMSVEGCKSIDQVKRIDFSKIERFATGIATVDKTIGGLIIGKSYILTGKRGEGKSTVASQMVCNVLKNSDANVLVYSGELPNYMFKSWLYRQASSEADVEAFESEVFGTEYMVTETREQNLDKRFSSRLFLIDDTYQGEILDAVEKSVKANGVKVVLVDNLMSLISRDASNYDNQFTAQSIIVNRLAAMARRLEIIVLLIVHPKKGKNEGGDKLDMISGSGDISNAVDSVMWYTKNDDQNGSLEILKNRLNGHNLVNDSAVSIVYDRITKRITESNALSNFYRFHSGVASNDEEG